MDLGKITNTVRKVTCSYLIVFTGLFFLNPAQQPTDKHKQVNESHDNLTEIQAHTKSTHRSTLEMQQCWQKKLAKEASKRNISRETI